MQETYIKKDSFEDKTFVNQIDFDFLNKIESLRKKNEITKEFDQEDLCIIDRAIEDCKKAILSKDSEFKIKNNSYEEIKLMEDKNVIKYILHRYKYEIFPDKKILNKYPPLLQIEPSSVCNFRCVFCFMTDENFSQKKSKHMGVMSLDMYKRIVDQIEGKIQFITLASRGEPLVNKQIGQMLEFSRNKFLGLKINTNASLLNEKLIHDILTNDVLTVVFSADAAEKKLYEKLRVRGNFDKVIKNIKLFKDIKEKHYPKKKIITRVSGVKFSENQNFNEVSNFWNEHVDQVAFVKYNPWENSYEKKDNDITTPCSDLWRRMFIWWDGKANPCDVDYKSNLSVGNINQTDIEKIWNGKDYNKLRELHVNQNRQKKKPCSSCFVT